MIKKTPDIEVNDKDRALIEQLEAEQADLDEAYLAALHTWGHWLNYQNSHDDERDDPALKAKIDKEKAQRDAIDKKLEVVTGKIYHIYLNSYLTNRNHDANRVMDDLQSCFDALEPADFLKHLHSWEKLAELYEKDNATGLFEMAQKEARRNFDNFARYIRWGVIDVYMDALIELGADLYNVPDMAAACFERLYGEPVKEEDIAAAAPIITQKDDKEDDDEAQAAPIITRRPCRIAPRKLSGIFHPLSKVEAVSTGIYSLIEESADGQLTMVFKTGKPNNEKVPAVKFVVDWEKCPAEISRRLTEFDKRVLYVAGSHYAAGNKIVTLNMIHEGMGCKTEPSKAQLERINNSLTKMRAAEIKLNNSMEIKAGYKVVPWDYDGSFLPFERMTIEHRGKRATAIHLFREPPLFSFSKDRGQITRIPLPVLQTPLNKTEGNLKIESYLFERTAHMKNNKQLSRKILLSSIWESCGITGRTQKYRSETTIRVLMDHLAKEKWIKGYNLDEYGNYTIVL